MFGHQWTPAEDARLREAYAAGGIEFARDEFPGISDSSLYHRANRIGAAVRRRKWTSFELATLTLRWSDPGVTLAILSREFGRPQLGIYWKAHELGLRRGVPDGFVSIAAACRRCGVDRVVLRRILERAKVPTFRTLSRPGAPRQAFRQRYVDPDKAAAAVAAWTQTEVVEAAARDRGLGGDVLRRLLRIAGYAQPRRKAYWRIPTATIDAVIAARPEHVRAAAKRHGLTPVTLSGWLVEAGVMVKGSRRGLPSAVMDRVVAQRRGRKGCRAWVHRAAKMRRAA